MTVSIAAASSNVNQPAELATVIGHLRDNFDSPLLHLDGPAARLTGGFWAEMWTLALTGHADPVAPNRVVLRLAPDARLAARETTIQAGVAAQGYPTPRVYATAGSQDGMRAWCVMEFANGHPLLGGLNGIRAITALPRLATGLPDTLAKVAVELHRLNPDPIVAALAAIGETESGVDEILEHHHARAVELSDERLARVVEQLAAGRPVAGRPVICHGDLHPFNVLTDNGHRVVLDWTAARLAEPACDLAFTHLLLANPPLTAPAVLRPIINTAATRIANRFIATYAKLSGTTIERERVDWYRKLHATRILLELAGWRTDNTADQHTGHPWFQMEPGLRNLVGI